MSRFGYSITPIGRWRVGNPTAEAIGQCFRVWWGDLQLTVRWLPGQAVFEVDWS